MSHAFRTPTYRVGMTIFWPITTWLEFVMVGFAARRARIDTLKRMAMPYSVSPALMTYTVPRGLADASGLAAGVRWLAREGLGAPCGGDAGMLAAGEDDALDPADGLAPPREPPQPATVSKTAAVTTIAWYRVMSSLAGRVSQGMTETPAPVLRRGPGRKAAADARLG